MRIFISYRREDSADVTGRIYDRLTADFGREAIFKDVDDIPLGVNFKDHLNNVVAQCAVELVVIGQQWLDAQDSRGRRRLDDPTDFVRIEVEAALSRGVPVIPILVRDASMPEADQLPPGMVELAYRNGTHVRPDPDFHRDVDRLVNGLEGYVRPQAKPAKSTGQVLSRATPAPVRPAPMPEAGQQTPFFRRWWRVGAGLLAVAIFWIQWFGIIAIGSQVIALLLGAVGLEHAVNRRWSRAGLFLLTALGWILSGSFGSLR